MRTLEAKITQQTPITFVELQATSGGRLDSKPVGDIYSGTKFPSRGVDLLKEIHSREGWTDVVAIDPRFNSHPNQLNESDLRRIMSSPVLGLSLISRTVPQSKELARRYKEANPNGIIIVGGNHATFKVDECLGWADIVVRYEGDRTSPELLEALAKNGTPKGVKGVSYKDGDTIVNEPNRSLLTEEEMDSLPWPNYDPLIGKGATGLVIITSRGCIHGCDFCTEAEANEHRYRRIGNKVIIPRFRQLYGESSQRIFWADDNFAGKPKETEELLREISAEKLNADKRLVVQLHAEIGLRKGFPDLLREAGVFLATLGLESINEAALASLGKASNPQINIEGTRAIREAGVLVHAMIIAGADGDTVETLMDQLEWLKKHVDTIQIFTPGPLPGTPFTRRMEGQGRILRGEEAYHLYDGHYVLVRPKDIPPYDLQMLVPKMYEDFYSFKLLKDAAKRVFFSPGVSFRQRWDDLKRDVIVRAYARYTGRALLKDPQTKEHLEFLKAQNYCYQ